MSAQPKKKLLDQVRGDIYAACGGFTSKTWTRATAPSICLMHWNGNILNRGGLAVRSPLD